MAGPYSPNANIASSIMGASIGKACLCPTFPLTQNAFTSGMCGFYGKKYQNSQYSDILQITQIYFSSKPAGFFLFVQNLSCQN
jgi:hypothetical protein